MYIYQDPFLRVSFSSSSNSWSILDGTKYADFYPEKSIASAHSFVSPSALSKRSTDAQIAMGAAACVCFRDDATEREKKDEDGGQDFVRDIGGELHSSPRPPKTGFHKFHHEGRASETLGGTLRKRSAGVSIVFLKHSLHCLRDSLTALLQLHRECSEFCVR
jgi:hypothetical protein